MVKVKSRKFDNGDLMENITSPLSCDTRIALVQKSIVYGTLNIKSRTTQITFSIFYLIFCHKIKREHPQAMI